MKVEDNSFVGFYNSTTILLTCGKPLREAMVEDVSNNPDVKTFKEINGTNNVVPWTDVSLLHKRRMLYYSTFDDKLFSFNVDTRENTILDF